MHSNDGILLNADSPKQVRRLTEAFSAPFVLNKRRKV
jgi:hypothetical protein